MGSPVGNMVEMEGSQAGSLRHRTSGGAAANSRQEPAARQWPEYSRASATASGAHGPPDGGPCSVEVVHASKPPVHHHPAASRSRLPDGGPCSVVVVLASKPPVRHHPAAGRSRLPDGGPCRVVVVRARKPPVRHQYSAIGRAELQQRIQQQGSIPGPD
jgi:hypothetical protein